MPTVARPTRHVTDPRVDELADLVGTFSQVADRLRESHDRLTDRVADLQAQLVKKNRLLVEQQRELDSKRRELERQNRLAALGEMAAALAHEIRNPLGGIGLFASAVADDLEAGRHASAASIVHRLREGVARLEQVVGRTLSFAGEIHVRATRVDLAATVRRVADHLSADARRRGIQVVVDAPDSCETVVDEGLVEQALFNLVQNATEAAVSRVRVGCDAGGSQVSVADDGPGLPPGVDLEELCRPFFTTRRHGTGLGLSVVQRVAVAHGGRLEASPDPTGGACFRLHL